MNLKYYLRGLGIGVIVTAVIMLVLSSQNTRTLTDEEIKQKARALGMVEQEGTLSEMALPQAQDGSEATTEAAPSKVSNENDGENETALAEATEEPLEPDMSSSGNMDYNEVEKQIDEADAKLEEIKSGSVESPEEVKPTPKPTPEPTSEPTKEPEPTPEPVKETKTYSDGKSISFEVNKGESSYAVAKNLQAAGFISNASSFDTYLCSTGMDRKICAGTFSIPEGSSEEEIAKIISRQ